MKEQAITTVIFDIGNVLLQYDNRAYIARKIPDPSIHERLRQAIFLNPAWAESDRNVCSAEETLRKFIDAAPDLEREIRFLYAEAGDCVTLFPFAVPWIRSLKGAGFRVFCLSNYSEYLYRKTREKMEFLPLLDGVLFSWQCHLLKPEPEIYRLLFDTYGIDPARSVFLDDMQENIEAARRAGLHTVLFRDYETASAGLNDLLEKHEGSAD